MAKSKGKVLPFKKPRKNECANNHPGLDLGGIKIYGGSCHRPVITAADVYISLDTKRPSSMAYPWRDEKGAIEVLFPITNNKAPDNYADFIDLVEWTLEQMDEGKLVHAGCFAGHGRTGIFLAAIVAQLGLDDDPIKFVRKNYCSKAVESREQIDFLVNVFGCKKAEPRQYSKIKKLAWDDNDVPNQRKLGFDLDRRPGTDYGVWFDDWKKGGKS